MNNEAYERYQREKEDDARDTSSGVQDKRYYILVKGQADKKITYAWGEVKGTKVPNALKLDLFLHTDPTYGYAISEGKTGMRFTCGATPIKCRKNLRDNLTSKGLPYFEKAVLDCVVKIHRLATVHHRRKGPIPSKLA